MATKKFKVTCKDMVGDILTLAIFDDGRTNVDSNEFTIKLDSLEIKHSLDAIFGFTQILDKFEMNSIEIERV